jgi:alpha-tubulin suppressor-like RCC1 family protein
MPGATTRKDHTNRFLLLLMFAAVGGCDITGPEAVSEAVQWAQLSANTGYTCALTSEGEMYCWGGVLGFRTPYPIFDSIPPLSSAPYQVLGETRYAAVSVSETGACGLDLEGAASCWGANQLGDVGIGDFVARRSPAPVAAEQRWAMVTSGSSHRCGVTHEGEGYCWGNEFRGALGNGRGLNPGWAETVPAPVLGDRKWSEIRAGAGFTCGLTPEGRAYCWGANDSGQIGTGVISPNESVLVPTPVTGNLRFALLSVGAYQVCGLTEDGTAYCWGFNAHGQLGDGTTSDRGQPTAVAGGHRWTQLSVGRLHTCGLSTDGGLYCWGRNDVGQLGNGTTSNATAPTPVATQTEFRAVVAGGDHTCARSAARKAYCWGDNDAGQLGVGDFESRTVPARVMEPRFDDTLSLSWPDRR